MDARTPVTTPVVSCPEPVRAFSQEAEGASPVFVEQQLDQSFLERIKARPGCLAPIFLESSLVKDHIAYAEYQHPFIHYTRYVAKWKRPPKRLSHHPLVVHPPELNQEDFKRWRSELHAVVKKQVWPKAETVTEADLLAHLSLFAPTVMGSLSAAQQVAWLEWCAGELGPVEADSYTESADELQLIITCEIERGGTEARLTEVLRERAARVGSHRVRSQRPTFQGGRINSGKCFEIDYQDGSLRYVPHGDLGDVEVEMQLHRAVPALVGDLLASAREQIDAEFATRAASTAELVCRISHYVHDDQPERVEIIRQSEVPDQEQVDFQAALASTFRVRRGTGSKKRERDVETLLATDALIEDARISERARMIRTKYGWMTSRDFKAYKKQHTALEALAECGEITYSTGAGQRVGKGLHRAIKERFKEHECLREMMSLLKTSEARGWFEITTRSQTVTRKLKHRAPLSERGLLTVRGLGLEQACDALIEFGIAQGIAPAMLETHQHHLGRVIPRHPEYLFGEAPPTLPKGFAIFHTLTGVTADGDVFARLGSMARTGGIASFSERRRLHIDVPSLDPTGDAIQGIDIGVPASIGKYPPYAQYGSVSFLIKPEALCRRDIWFSGETGWSFKHYADYAQLIGQGKFFAPCPPEAAKTHLASELGDSNEVYFSYMVPWEDIDALVVSDAKLGKKIGQALDDWVSQAMIPTGIQVLSGSWSEIRSQIKRRAAALATSG